MRKKELAIFLFMILFSFNTIVNAQLTDIKKSNDFLHLCAVGTMGEVEQALVGQNVQASTADGMTGLMYAVHYNIDSKVTRLLLEAGFFVNAVDNKGMTVLMHSMYLHNVEIVKLLLDNKADVNQVNVLNNKTALMYAVEYSNDLAIIKLLLEKGADINAVDVTGKSALFYACRYNTNLDIVKYLLDSGILINQKDINDITPLMITTMNPYIGKDIAELLLKEGADITSFDKNMRTALIFAAQNSDDLELYKTLLKYGADTTFSDLKGSNALDYAVYNERESAILKLLSK